MSHHISASSTNPAGAVEVVHVHSSSAAAATAPVDGGGRSGTPGANLPVENIEQASNTIQRGKADLAQTAGAERRLDGFDGVGGGGGGGNAGGANANANNATGAVAQGTANENVSDQQNGLAAQRSNGAQTVSSLPDQDPRS